MFYTTRWCKLLSACFFHVAPHYCSSKPGTWALQSDHLAMAVVRRVPKLKDPQKSKRDGAPAAGLAQ